MWEISEVKQIGKMKFKNNYWPCVLVSFILTLLSGMYFSVKGNIDQLLDIAKSGDYVDPNSLKIYYILSYIANEISYDIVSLIIFITLVVIVIFIVVSVVSAIYRIFIYDILQIGSAKFFLENARTGNAKVGSLGFGFTNGSYKNEVYTSFLVELRVFLWSLLFVIPGIIKAYEYALVPYILADEPYLSPEEVLNRSKNMMQGNKMKLFALGLSFIGWYLLTIVTFGLITIFWTNPYVYASVAEMYRKLKGETDSAYYANRMQQGGYPNQGYPNQGYQNYQGQQGNNYNPNMNRPNQGYQNYQGQQGNNYNPNMNRPNQGNPNYQGQQGNNYNPNANRPHQAPPTYGSDYAPSYQGFNVNPNRPNVNQQGASSVNLNKANENNQATNLNQNVDLNKPSDLSKNLTKDEPNNATGFSIQLTNSTSNANEVNKEVGSISNTETKIDESLGTVSLDKNKENVDSSVSDSGLNDSDIGKL